MSDFTETTEQLRQILRDDINSLDNGNWSPDADSVEAFGEVAAEIARRELAESQVYVLLKDDIDACLESRDVTDEQKAACYDAVRDMDSSSIFEQVEVLCDMALDDIVRTLRERGDL